MSAPKYGQMDPDHNPTPHVPQEDPVSKNGEYKPGENKNVDFAVALSLLLVFGVITFGVVTACAWIWKAVF